MKLLFLLLLSINTFAQTALSDGALIQRPIEDAAMYSHFGVMYGGKVTHYDKEGIHVSGLKEFSNNKKIRVVTKGLSGKQLEEFKARYKVLVKNYTSGNYNALSNNCEHFAFELVLGIKKSFQSEQSVEIFMETWKQAKKEIITKNPQAESTVALIDLYLEAQLKKQKIK